MPNGRWTTKRVGSVTIGSGHSAILDPFAFADLLGIDRDTAKRVLGELVQEGKAHQWHAMNDDYKILRHDLDDGRVSYEVHP
jgi:hypothetical protein